MRTVVKGSDLCARCGHKRYRHRVERPDNSLCMNMTCACPDWVEPKNVYQQIKEAGEAGLLAGTIYITKEEKLMPNLEIPECEDCGHPYFHHNTKLADDSLTVASRPCGEPDCQCANFAWPNGVNPKTASLLNTQAEDDAKLSEDEITKKVVDAEWSVNRARRAMGMKQPVVETDENLPMLTDEFTRLIEEQVARSTSLLVDKAKEYASDTDRLHNFKIAATLLGGTPEQALGGFLAKHIVSVFDMINSGKDYPEAVWNEKITDSINYLLILRAMQR